MYKIKYSILNYYHSPISDECLSLGVLIHNVTTGERVFRYISNFRRFQSFDDEADVDFVKLYLKGIKEEVEVNLFNFNTAFSLDKYIIPYANDFRFSKVNIMDVSETEDYVDDLVKIYLKFDLNKSQRMSDAEEKRFIRRIFIDNNIHYSTEKICGPYNDDIAFDYSTKCAYIKFFNFKGKNLKRLVSNARQWAFAADELASKKNVLFVYDTDYMDKDNLDIILKILSKNAEVLKFTEGMNYIIENCG